MSSLTSLAQSNDDVIKKLSELKTNYICAGNSKEIKDAIQQLDEFLSHVKIVQEINASHNIIPCFCCYYDSIPLAMSAILHTGTKADTIQFRNGKWYNMESVLPGSEIDLLCFEHSLDNRKIAALKPLDNKYRYRMNNMQEKSKTAFFVKEEGLFYAAIESKKIPSFSLVSNNEILNYASCLKLVLKASNVDATYDEIIRQYLNTTIDEQFLSLKDCKNTINGREVVTTFIPKKKVEPKVIVDELLKDRFMITIGNNGNIGVLTAIAITGKADYQPVLVRLRMPIPNSENPRVQLSWRDFYENIIALVKVDIY